jgi:hypothetical protein
MRGVVLTKFLDMKDRRFGAFDSDRVVGNSDLSPQCAYTSVGTYDYSELDFLVSRLSGMSERSKLKIPNTALPGLETRA